MKRSLATEGATLVYTSLLVMMLVAMTLVVTSQIALRSRSSSQEQNQLLVAQYAAEAGIARGQNQLAQVQKALGAIALPHPTSETALRSYVASFCGVSVGSVPAFSKVALAQPLKLCSAGPGSTTGTLLAGLMPAAAMPAGWTAATWTQLFGTGYALPEGTVNGASVNVKNRLVAVDVLQTDISELQLRMRVGSVQSTGVSSPARRVLNASSDGLFVLTFSRPSFATYAQFRNHTTSATTGGALYFSDGEEFRGPVHTNETLRLSGNPKFYGELTTAGAAVDYQGLPCTKTVLDAGTCASVFPEGGKPTYNTGVIPLPTNSNNQMRAALGLSDTTNTNAVTSTELNSALGVSTVGTGVYMSKPGTPNTLFGGLYVQGDAKITLSTTGNNPTRQIIEISQTVGGVVQLTKLQEGASGNWTRRIYNGATMTSNTPMQGSFNGVIYVNGSVDLYGDNTTAPDIGENSALNISLSNGDMKLKNSVTYSQDPTLNPDALNVLGLFNSTGTILLDGPSNQDMNVNATILASANGKGFGTVNASSSRGSPKPNVNLIGGVVEDQSQTVSAGSGGYNRKYKYDPRFSDGYGPPYFPTQQKWESNADAFFDTGVLKQGR
ncbi:DUF4900 domain-containing protein [Deinococcus koreensis]|uniref:DUF4900 domain-containing protein n=1 Tax=Deinococcus koreensis TaxID=2054903 RepID=A0A2K3UYC3_9DEIO|nr:DUF4900 domain-containing protein [Deinococcus koreensis]PNY81527.1 hypothetical protein CVO96_09175 [Deinococcus koreensis]